MYGEPEPGDGAQVDTSLKASLLRLKIRSPELIGSADTVKKIPSSMNVRALRSLLQRLYKSQAGGSRLRISLLSSDNCEVEIDKSGESTAMSSCGVLQSKDKSVYKQTYLVRIDFTSVQIGHSRLTNSK